MSQSNPFYQFVEQYADDWVGFAHDVLGLDLYPEQAEIVRAVQRGERRISVRSGHGVGKSTTAAVCLVCSLIFRFPFKGVVTAPTTGQLYDALFAEFKSLIQRLPPFAQELLEVKAERVELRAAPNDVFVAARTSRSEQPEALQGVHSAHVLLIADEAAGVPDAVFEAAAGSMSGHNATTLLLSNPTRSSGYFFNTQTNPAMGWLCFHISCLTSKNVSQDFINEIRDSYGEDSNAWRVRVLGEFPKADDDTVVPYALVDAATTRDVKPILTAVPVWGLDVARFGGDSSALIERRGNYMPDVLGVWTGLDLMALCGRVKAQWDATQPRDRPAEINVDSIGLGAGVVDRLRELGLPARGVNVSEAAALSERYVNLRAELWFAVREWFAGLDVRIPKHDRLIAELTLPRFRYAQGSGKLQIESKDEMRKRARRSPDVAEALMLTFAGTAARLSRDPRAYGNTNWSQPLRRRGVSIS